MKVLIAEDDKFLTKAYKMKLRKQGHEVQVAADGKALFTALDKFNPDLILLDLVMPNMDGFKALEKLKSTSEYQDIPVVIASNLGQKEDIETCKKLGAAKFVIKSNMSIQELLNEATAVVSQSDSADS